MTKSSSKKYVKKRKSEGFFKLAKKEKVRARSYFKLEQLDKKFNLIKNNQHILDLGCAPGGWLEYIQKKNKKVQVIGIDILEVKDRGEFGENFKIIEDDFDNLEEYIDKEEKFDLIISDIAPEFSGNSKLDRGRTHILNSKTIEISKKWLKKGGNLLFKTFEGEDLEEVRKLSKKEFKLIKDFKPLSSQKGSSEFYIVCFEKI